MSRFCTNCGNMLPDDGEFCPNCGMKFVQEVPPAVQTVPDNMNPVNDSVPEQPLTGGAPDIVVKKRTPKALIPILIIALVVCLLGGAGAFFVVRGTPKARVQRHLEKAEHYLSELDYDHAILEYQSAISIDHQCADAYLGLAQAFEKNEEYDETLQTLIDADDAGVNDDRLDKFRKKFIKKHGFDIMDEELYALIEDELNKYKENFDINIVSTDTSDYPIVRLYVNLTNTSGEQIDINNPKVKLKEYKDGAFIEREVKRMEKLDGKEGISIELVTDKSGSMDYMMDRVQEVMSDFVGQLDYQSGDVVELIAFDSYIMYMCTRTNDATLLKNGIHNMVPDGSTALYDALIESLNSASNQTGARCVIAFTDGEDNVSTHSYQEVINLAKNLSIPVYIIGMYQYADTALQSIADSTGGHYWYINDLADMEDIFDEVYVEQKDLYVIEYVCDEGDFGQFDQRDISLKIADRTYFGEEEESCKPVEVKEKEVHTSRYEVVKADISWTQANEAAMQKGGHLVTITSQAEMDKCCQLAESKGLVFCWMGGYTSRNGYSNVFAHWVTGEPFNYTKWYKGEPSRDDRDGTPEMYLMLWNIDDEWSWNDQRDNPIPEFDYFHNQTGYIIEYEDVS